jgi:hypothetical protein
VRGFLVFIFFLFLVWAGWVSLSTGGLYELRQFNPDYAHPNRNAAYLISKVNYSEDNGMWDFYHVEQCSQHMPNWEKAKRCVEARVSCELKSPKTKDAVGFKDERDIFSEIFASCLKNKKPSLGPMELLRLSRTLWRGGVFFGSIWLTGGFSLKGKEDEVWRAKNDGWVKPLRAWFKEGD